MADDPKTSINQEPISMKRMDTLKVVVFTAVFTAALVVGIVSFARIRMSGGSSDDAPIVMAGGSFHMYGGGIGKLEKEGKNKRRLIHHENNSKNQLKVSSVDLIAPSGLLIPIKGFRDDSKGMIDFQYCERSDCLSGDQDTITLAFDNAATEYIVVVSAAKYDIETSTNNGGVLDFPFPGWYLKTVKFRGWTRNQPSDVSCDPSGHCTMLVRTCKPGFFTVCP